MTEDRKKLIARFQTWLDTNPRKELIASECANIAEQYHTEQSKLFGVGVTLPKSTEPFSLITKQITENTDRVIDFIKVTKGIMSPEDFVNRHGE